MDIHSLLHSVLDWVSAHPHWVPAAMFLVASAESLAVAGLIVPGAAAMVAAGALIASGAISFWPTLFASVAGAIAGDGISYWIGRHYRERLRTLWPFHRHPQWLSRGENFFLRHGVKSVLFGRFVGPMRPIIPVVAGMLGMRPVAFYAVNVSSALVWAPAYLLPGMAFGASLAVAGMVAVRLAALLVLLGTLIWLVLWIIHRLFDLLSPRAALRSQRLIAWGERHPRANMIISGLMDPSQPEFKTLLVTGGLLIGAAWLFLGILEDVVTGDPLVRADQGVYQLMQGLRTPWGDRIMVFLTELGDSVVIALVAAAVLAWLLWRRNWRAAGYWAGAVGFGQLAATLIKQVLQRPRPLADLYEGLSTYAFPSGHATMSMVVYGFLAVLVARSVFPPRRWLAYAVAALLICAIATSRLYLGAHWLSDVIGGLSLGLAWVCLLAIAYYRHSTAVPLPRSLPGVALLALALAGAWHVSSQYSADLQGYARRLSVQHLDAASWWQDDWRRLPTYRQDLAGEFGEPLNVQWSGTLASVRATLSAQGWREPVPLNATTALRWLLPAPRLAELPVLPQVHDGRHESLLMLGPPDKEGGARAQTASEENRQLVLRLWLSGTVLDPDAVPLWVGNVSLQGPRRILFLMLPVTAREFDVPRERLMQSLHDVDQRVAGRSLGTAKQVFHWSASVLLMRQTCQARNGHDAHCHASQ